MKLDDIQYARDLAMVQIQVDKAQGIDRFNDYRKALFPWLEASKERADNKHKKLLEQAVKMGPLSVRPINMKPMKSRLVKQIDRTKLTEEQRRKQNDLYKQLGKSLPI